MTGGPASTNATALGRHKLLFLISTATATFAACSGADPPSTLDPAGPGAQRIAGLWWLMFWISAFVFALVCAFLVVSVIRRRRPGTPERDVRWGGPFVVLGGIVVPGLVLGGVFLVSLRDMSTLSSPPTEAAMTIEVVARDWWWEARYRTSDGDEVVAVTANEIHIPVGRSIQLELTTDDVIHSFWVPRLQAKTDHVPGMVNTMWLHADRPDRYRGQCAEFCGLQHANMIFYVVAEPPDDFEAWLDNESQSAATPAAESARLGEDVFVESACAGCHTIQGTEATGDLGPDLTHVGGRETIAAGVLANTRANMATWISDPQGVKPGTTMPPVEFSGDELEQLLDYLEQLD